MKLKREIFLKNPELLEELYKTETNPEVLKKIVALKLYANLPNERVNKLCEIVGINKTTLYLWIDKWNKEGYEGLLDQRGNSGRPSKLSEEQLNELKMILHSKKYWHIEEIAQILQNEFGVSISIPQLRRILLYKLDMNFVKPQVKDIYKLPDELQDLIKQEFAGKENIAYISLKYPQERYNGVWTYKDKVIIKHTHKNAIGFVLNFFDGTKPIIHEGKVNNKNFNEFLKIVEKETKNKEDLILIVPKFPFIEENKLRKKLQGTHIEPLILKPPRKKNFVNFVWNTMKQITSFISTREGGLEEISYSTTVFVLSILGVYKNIANEVIITEIVIL